MFCGKCGTKNRDDAIFCTGCGAKINGNQIPKEVLSVEVNSFDKNRKVGMIAVAAIVVVVIVAAILLLGGRSYKATVEQYIDAQFQGDAEALFELIPEEMIADMLEDIGYEEDEIDKAIDEANEEIQSYLEYIEEYLGEDWEVSYEILSVEDMTSDDLDDLKDDYEEVDVKISAAKIVEIQLTIKTEETESSNTMDISLIKVGRSWYLDLKNMGSIF